MQETEQRCDYIGKKKINRIIQRQKEMLASGEKNGPVIKKSMQRMAVQSLIVFFTLMFVCTVISRVSFSITTASVSGIDHCKRDAYGKGFRGRKDPGGSRQKH